MTPSRKTLLKRVFEHDRTNSEPLRINIENEDGEYIQNLDQLDRDIDWLTREDYIFQPIDVCGYYVLALTEKGERFVENDFCLPSETPPATTFNFSGATINNAAIGNDNTVGSMTYNAGTALDELETVISRRSSEEQILLNEMLDLLREMQRAEQPLEKGRLTRFYELVKKSSDLVLPIGQFLFEIFFAPGG